MTPPSNRYNEDSCPDCGASVTGGRAGCQALWEEITVQAYSDLRYAAVYNLAFDTYCMQHLDTYCRSAKSYAAHLTRLCCGLEHSGNPAIYAAIQKWLNGSVSIEKPESLSHLGHLTIADVQAARTGEEFTRCVQAWAESVWDAYTAQHDIARTWIETALGLAKKAK